jgi:hypothetical protein
LDDGGQQRLFLNIQNQRQMIELSAPEELLAQQNLYRIGGNVDKARPAFTHAYKLVVVLSQPFNALPAALKEMVEKLIAACKLDSAQVAYTDVESADISYQNIIRAYRPEVILVFGEIALSRNLNGLKKNQPYEFNGTKILLAQTLDYIAKTQAEKSALWVGLQKTFLLK